MANKYFLGSVGTVEAFRRENGEMKLAFRSKTLTDSGLNISTTKDDIRAGTGAPIQFSFYHDPSVEITLTDVLFDEAYIEAQLGADFAQGGTAYQTETITAASTSVTLAKTPLALSAGCNSSEVVVWYSVSGSNEWARVAASNVSGSTISGLTNGVKYCFRYLAQDDDARIAEITSEIIPQELFLIITAPVFSGDACSASNGKRAGTITYEIPRFKLNGAQEFTMNMSSNQTMSLSGTALASEDGCDMNASGLLRIIVKYDDLHWYSNVKELIPDEDYLKVGDIPHVYALTKDGDVFLINNDNLTFTPALSAGAWAEAGSQNIKVTGNASIEDTVTIASAA